MIPVHQTRFGGKYDPVEEQGNCLQACIASIFELPLGEVPHFGYPSIDSVRQHNELVAWLRERNIRLSAAQWTEHYFFAGYWLLSGPSANLGQDGGWHVVVVRDNEIVHDPRPNSKGLRSREHMEGFEILDPANQKPLT